ncbi:MAG: hypothetical protein JSV79_00945 [Armatimonadota bacterium]|nr:MAG: hypothetical protein JSV79_00945 [Armatimonadota bacterium]
MTDFEKDLRRAVAAQSLDPAHEETMMKEIRSMYEHRMGTVRTVTWLAHLVLTGLLLWGLWMLFHSPMESGKVVGGVIAFIGGTTLHVMKIWYWVLNTKYGVLTEIKALQVQVAELAERLPEKD